MANKVNKTVIGKSPALGVKMAAPAAIMVATAKAMSAKSNEEENFKMLVATLQSELEAERKTVRQLRRERDAEVVKVRNEEQTKSSTALKDLTKKLQEEKLKEVELQREALKSKLEFDQGKVVKLKDREIAKLRGDLARCQDELKEELSKRGLSTSARATFDTERQKLLQEVRDLQIAKRQLEDRLSSAGENEKRLQLEIIRLQENCKQEVARVEREANVEVKKLLDELKSKDHMLELMDRSIYPDRATMLKTRLDKLSIEEMLNLTHEQVNVWSYCSNSNGRSNRSRSNSAASNRSNSNNSNGSNRTCQIYADVKSEDVRKIENQESAGGIQSASSNRRRCVGHSKCGTTNINKSKRSYSACSRSHTSFSGTRKGRSKSAGAAIRSSQTANSIDKDNSCSLDTSYSFISNTSKDGSLKNEHIDNSASTTTETNISAPSGHDNCVIKGGCALQVINLQKKLYEAEKKLKLAEGLQRAVIEKNKNLSVNGNQLESKIKSLNEQIRNMNNERALNKREIKRLNEVIANINGNSGTEGDSNSELQNCRQRCEELEQVLVSLRHDCLEKDRRIGLLIKSHQKHRHKYEPKTVRFMLPDESDGKESEELTESTNSLSSSSCSDPIESDELLLQSVHKDYETLMQEHLKLEKYCTSLIQSKTGNDKSINQELSAKRESLDLVIEAMEEKLKMADEREKKLRHQLQEIYDQNEELEFRILELEEFSERKISSCQQNEAEDSHAQLIAEIERLRRRLCQYEALSVTDLEKEASSQCAPTTLEGDPLRLSVENLRKLRASLSDSDEENQMVQSFSTMTSGFDEISCISLELDDRTEMPDMPAEEEADLEQDADDIGAEMPSEVYDEIPEMVQNFSINYSHTTDAANPTNGIDSFEEGSDQKMHSVIDNSNLSSAVNIMAKDADDSIIYNTSACLVAEPSCIINSSIVANEITQTPKPDVENQAYISQTISPLEHNKAHTPWFNANSQRIVDLEDQLDILACVDCKYSETIKMLNDIEEQLTAVIPSTEMTCETAAKSSEETLEVDKTIDQFWPSASEEINDQIAVAKVEMKTFPFEDSMNLELNDSQGESRSAMQHCTEVLQITQTILQEDSIKCKELDTRIQALELQQNCESSYDIFENVTRNEQNSFADCQFTQQQPLLCLAGPSDSSLLGSLKRLALDVVAAGFRADLLELKSLTHDFFAASEDEELKDIAFIDGDESTCIEESDASAGAEIEGPTRLQKRTELRLNTKMSCMNQRFDFLSPTSFDHPEWNDFNHLETVNHCLLTQMEELEKERDSLKDIVYRDDAVINEMTQQIDRLQNSEQEFKERISKLEATEMEAGQHINRIEAHCDELRAKLKRAESMETSLRNDLEARCKSQAEIEAKLLKSVQSLEQTTVKLRSNLNEVEKEKSEAIKQSEELQAQILSLQSKEYKTLHKIKSLENLHGGLCEKTSDLESSLTLAYDEVTGLTRQKEGLTQRLNSITDENTDLRRENDELIVEKINLAKEVERLSESENFLKEANRKMWLSLQANIDEYGMCKKCKNFCSDVDEETTSSVDMISLKSPICKEISVQTEKITRCRRNKSSHQGSKYGFQQGFTQFASNHTHIVVAIANLITHLSSRSCKLRNLSQRQKLWSEGSLETEKKARIEEMLKFVNSSRYRSKSNENSARNAITGKQNYEAEDADKPQNFGDDVSELDAVEGEEEFWNVVENYEDIYDVRAADTWNLWRHLELDLMRLNLDDLRKLLESREADKSCQTSPCDFPSSLQQSMQFPSSGSSKIEEFETEPKAEVHTPPLPTTLPPDDENLLMNDIISCSEQSTQTETIEKSVESNVKDRDDSTTLLHLLNQNERTLSAQKNEVDRLTIEMRSWQQKALEAADQVSRLTTELSTAQQLIESTKDRSAPRAGSTSSIIDNNSQHLMTIENRRSRIELPSSQIPVSVKRAVDFYSSISQSSGSTSPGPIHSKTSLIPRLVPEAVKSEHGAHPTTSTKITTQGPLSNGSSSSQQQQQDVQPSLIPRLLPEWIQQQQQQQLIQQREDGSNSESCDGNMATDSSLNLQQLPAAEAATAAAAAGSSDVHVAAEMETEVPQHPGVESVDMPGEEF